jgi:hypothetical protein
MFKIKFMKYSKTSAFPANVGIAIFPYTLLSAFSPTFPSSLEMNLVSEPIYHHWCTKSWGQETLCLIGSLVMSDFVSST